jgi:hypothetical protein
VKPGNRHSELFLVCSIGLAWLYLLPLHKAVNNPNENVRVYATRALVEHGTWAIGERREAKGGGFQDVGGVQADWGYVNDRALTCQDPKAAPPDCAGKLYQAKSPGTSLLGVPAYWLQKTLYHWLGKPVTRDGAVMWLRLLAVLLPSLLFYLYFFRFVLHRTGSEPAALLGTWMLAFGSLMATYHWMFAGHVHAAIFLFGGFMAADLARDDERRRRGLLLWSGFLLGWAVLAEYPALFGVPLVAGMACLTLPRKRDVLWLALGGLLPALLLAHYHHACFGSALRTPYQVLENVGFRDDIAPGFLGLTWPSLARFGNSFFGSVTGLFWFDPFALLLLPAALWLAWRRRRSPDALGALAVAMVYVLFLSSHSLWRGGWTVGPRYIAMAAPFFAFFVVRAVAWLPGEAWGGRGLVLGLALVSLWNRSLADLTTQGYPFEFDNPLYQFSWPLVRDGYVFRNLANALGVSGLASALPWLGLVGAGSLAVLAMQVPRARVPAVATLLLGLAVALGLGTFQATLPRTPNEAQAESLAWFRSHWEPRQQGTLGRELAALDAVPRARWTDQQRARWVTLHTLLGESRPTPTAPATSPRPLPGSKAATPPAPGH